MKRPPLGIIPEEIWKQQRLSDIDAAIQRYQEAGLAISTKWIFERNRLLLDIEYIKNPPFVHLLKKRTKVKES